METANRSVLKWNQREVEETSGWQVDDSRVELKLNLLKQHTHLLRILYALNSLMDNNVVCETGNLVGIRLDWSLLSNVVTEASGTWINEYEWDFSHTKHP